MKKSKVCFYGLLLVALASCTKEPSTLPVSSAEIQSASSEDNASTSGTVFGLLAQEKGINETEKLMATAGIKLVRAQVLFSKTTSSKAVDQYLKDGLNVQINFNWKATNNTPVLFPTDTVMIRQQAEAFFKYYLPYKNQIPVVVVENEWDNQNYRDSAQTTIEGYLTELTIITEVGHKYGFKIADAGISSTCLQRWMYSQLKGAAALKWKLNHFVGLNNNYDALVKGVSSYTTGIKKIGIDFSNVHWYNIGTCSNDFALASQTFMNACGKTSVISNEFGIREGGAQLFQQTVEEIRNNVLFAIAYSGVNEPGRAVELTDEMLSNF